MRILALLCTLLTFTLLSAQVSYNANTNVTPYNQPFRQAVNNGYFPGWINEQIADLSAGNQALNMPGVGARAMRVGFNEEIAELFGYDILKGLFRHYQSLGMGEHTMILGYPIDWHRDPTNYCPTARSAMFKGMYLPIWDGGANGTPYNDDNYLAAYTYKMVSLYKDDIRFWEIWNEPGFDLTYSKGWLPPNQPGNWWQNDPEPCDIIFNAPVEHYIRTLRVSYDIIKTLDPDGYVCASGLGYPSFLDAILRNTDNPNGGGVSADYPLKGGAYFDAVGFHSYPHFDGSVRYWDNTLGQMVDARHSDGAADGTIRVWLGYETVLNAYGYNDLTFPRKVKMITEGNIPRKAYDVGTPNESLGGTEVQRNYAIKNIVRLMQNGFAQYDIYQLFENKTLAAATAPYDVMGLYELPTAIGVTPPRTEHAIGYHTVSRMLFNTNYNASRTAAMNLPANVGGAAFLNPNGKYVYVLWAKTQTDRSEFAAATYSFPSGLGVTGLTRREWNFGQTNSSVSSPSANITLTSAPIFLTDDTTWPTAIVNPTNKVDLSLALTANPPNPTAGSNYTWSLTITNNSANNATGVEVGNFMEFEKQFILDRITYVSHAAPAGTTYTPLTGTWIIGSIPAGQSRTLTVTTRAVHGGIYKTFGQVTKCDQLDVDSAPLNGQAIKQPFEDDETFYIVNNNGFIDTKADMVVEATNYPATANSGATIPCNFMVRNNGRVNAPGSTLTMYLSTDAQFSANDQFLSFVNVDPLPAFAYDLQNITVNLPAGLISGSYYLLFHADFGAQVDEADENNVFARAIFISGSSTPTCSLTATTTNIQCFNANTFNITSDDTFSATLQVNTTGTGTNWTSVINGTTVTGTYGTALQIQLGLISNGVSNFTIRDVQTPTCTTQVQITPPPVCSNPNTCTIQATVSNILCNGQGTSNTSDDTYSFTVRVTGTGAGASWTGTFGSQPIAGAYATDITVNGGLISAGQRVLTVSAINNATCSNTVTVTPPAPCSSGTNTGTYCTATSASPWEDWIAQVQMGSTSYASGKSQYSDFTSKTFAVQQGTGVTLTAQYSYFTYDAYWRIWIDLNSDGDFVDAGEQVFEGIGTKPVAALNASRALTGQINLPASLTGGNRRMRVIMKRGSYAEPCETITNGEVEDYTAVVSTGGTPPGCQMSASVANITCSDNGTSAITSDDTYSFTLLVTGSGTGINGWIATNYASLSGNYGVARSVSGVPISNGVLNLTLTDAANTACTTTISVTPPAPCSSGGGNPPGTYCAASGSSPWEQWIAVVEMNGSNQASSKSQYSDFTSKIFSLQNGTGISLTAQYSYFTFDAYWRVWVDFNSDGDFADAGEQVLEQVAIRPTDGVLATRSISGSIAVPAGTPSGNKRMRVTMSRSNFVPACGTFAVGEVEDYTVSVSGGSTPVCQISAITSAITCSDNGTTATNTDDTFGFTLTVSGSNTGSGWTANVRGQTVTGSYGVPKTMSGYLISGGVLAFTVGDQNFTSCTTGVTVVPPTPCSNGGTPGVYCTSSSQFPWEDWISAVKVGAIVQNSGKSVYSDFTASPIMTATHGTSIELTSTFSYTTYDEYWRIWIDLNRDGDFLDTGENVFEQIALKSANGVGKSQVTNGVLSLPSTIPPGQTRMRVSMKRNAYADPCESLPSGEVEDYTVNLATQLQSSRLADGWVQPITIEHTSRSILLPNPTNNWTQLRFEEPTRAEAKIYITNQLGEIVEMQRGLPAGTETADFFVGHLAKGMYFVRVEVEGARGEVHRLVVLE